MSKRCGQKPSSDVPPGDPCSPPPAPCGGGKNPGAHQTPCGAGKEPRDSAGAGRPAWMAWFDDMIDHCYDYAAAAKAQGRPIVGILCEYTPREIIMAAGGVSVCLCGGSAEMIPAAEEDLPANLCPLIKSTYGYHVRKANPFLEMADLVVAETTCDGKKKMYELMGLTRSMHVLELPQRPTDPQGLEHWVWQIRGLRERMEGQVGHRISDDDLRQAIGVMNRERALRRRLAELMTSDRPPLTGRQLLDLKSSISGLETDFEQYRSALAELSGTSGPAERAGRVRVLLTGVPMAHGAERVLDIIEDSGGLVVCLETCSGLKPILQDVDETAADPLRAIAEKYFHLPCSVMTPNDERLTTLRRLAGQYRPQCVIELVWQACLTYDVESARVRRLVEDELHLPYLRISTDYSPSDSARIAVRVEALFETVRGSGVCAHENRPV